jgi:UDP-glucose 4-epimerase
MQWADIQSISAVCEGLDAIVHAAGMNARACEADPIAALEFNGLATARLAEAAIRADVSRLVYLSTAHVYARPLSGTISEDERPHNPHPYATTHLAGENAVLSACDGGRLDGTILRLSNAIGVPKAADVDCWRLLFCDLCREAIVDGTLTVRTNALQQRDFVALSDVCEAVEMVVSKSTSGLAAQIFNLGTGMSMTLLQLAALIQARAKAQFGTAPDLTELQPRTATPTLRLNIDRLRSSGFGPHCDFAAETDRMLLFCRQAFRVRA